MDESRFRPQQSPRNDAHMTSFVSPPRNSARFPQLAPHEPRSSMPRRFTADSSRVPALPSVISTMASPQRGQGLDTTQEYTVRLPASCGFPFNAG